MTQEPDSDLEIDLRPTQTPLPADERARRVAEPGFGRYFTDNVVSIRWTTERGWHDAALHAYQPLELDPAVMTLHYAQAVFEGLKAYRQVDGSLVLFRPWENAARFQRSAVRLAMPPLPESVFVGAIEALVRQDGAWVPENREHSLYLRPFMIATEVGLGVRPSASYLYMLLASPAGAYFPRGLAPVSVWLSEEYTRAAPGGTGEAKCAGNYAASLVAQAQAAEQGCDQVVWLDALEHRWVEEMGGMNLYFVYGSGPNARLMTPSLTGTLLPGVTRDSLLTLAKDLGYAAEEGRISTDEWRAGNASGAISEVFACGTAAVITPIAQVKCASGEWTVGDGEIGPVTARLREALLDIQYGVTPDLHGWIYPLARA
ncbi:MAG TPA: branched-chain amino acid aminotransferase [Actinomycetes bacterium]|nr:branched-chain amino acid aminotransferase [Actinomycetes bacterium]